MDELQSADEDMLQRITAVQEMYEDASGISIRLTEGT